jgi:hypothetical protein
MAEDIVVKGSDELIAALQKLGSSATNRAVLEAGARMLAGKLKVYPSVNRLMRASVYGATFKSEKQWHFFFWALRAGVIEVPYFRGQNPKSENLQQSWTVRVDSDTQASAGTQVSYAPMMMDASRQSKYAIAVGWRSAQVIASEATPSIQTAMDAALAQQAVASGLGD